MIIEDITSLEVGDDVYIEEFKIMGPTLIQKFWAKYIFLKYTPGTFYLEVKCDDDRLPDIKGSILSKDISVIYNEPKDIIK